MARRTNGPEAEKLSLKAGQFGHSLGLDFISRLADSFGSAKKPRAIEFVKSFNELLDEFGPKIEAAVYDSLVSAYVVSSAGVVAPLAVRPEDRGNELFAAGVANPPFNPLAAFYPSGSGGPQVHFPVLEEAANALESAGVLRSSDYYDLAAAARNNAFTITANVTDATLDKAREILAENVSTITSREDFSDRIRSELSSLPISDARLEQVFRNNVNAAYSDGTEKTLNDPLVADAFPYRAYYAIHDDRARKQHLELEKLGLDGTNVYHYRDPVWQMFRPPFDWNCRCGFNPLTIRRAAAKGVRFAQQWLDTGIEPGNQKVAWPPFLPSPSWQRLHPPIAA